MSVANFYLEHGYTPTWRTAATSGAGTITVWTPITSTRIALTGLAISSHLGGSIAFYFGNLAGSKLCEFDLLASTSLTPVLGAFESTVYDRTLVASVSGGGTDGFKITAFGFELP